MTVCPLWKNSEHDVYWYDGVHWQWVDHVESFTVRWAGEPRSEAGCSAQALLVVQMPADISDFVNGNSLRVVHIPCGSRGSGIYDQGDIRLQLNNCAVLNKVLDTLVTADPSQVKVVLLCLQLEGTLRLW